MNSGALSKVNRYLYLTQGIVPYIGYDVKHEIKFREYWLLLPHRLRQIRENRGFSQRELGKICGLGANQINRYENGTSEPTVQTLKTIAAQLEVTTDYLIGLADTPQSNPLSNLIETDERELLDTYRNQGWAAVIRLGAERLSK